MFDLNFSLYLMETVKNMGKHKVKVHKSWAHVITVEHNHHLFRIIFTVNLRIKPMIILFNSLCRHSYGVMYSKYYPSKIISILFLPNRKEKKKTENNSHKSNGSCVFYFISTDRLSYEMTI